MMLATVSNVEDMDQVPGLLQVCSKSSRKSVKAVPRGQRSLTARATRTLPV
jgi:hypothetical protein